MPKVSVIVPNYNYARFLPERMESIFSQTFQDYEIILLDDCSSDDSREVLESLRNHPKVKTIVYNEVNSGSPFKQWQKGVELASGEYVWIAEADDSSKPEFLSACVNLLDANPDAVLAFAGADVIDDDGKITDTDFDRWTSRQSSPEGYRILDGKKYVIHNMYWHTHVYNASGAVFRRRNASPDKFALAGKMRNAGDWLFWTMIIGEGKNIEIYRKLNIYRDHKANTTHKGVISGSIKFEDIKVMKYIEDHFNVGSYRKKLRHGQFEKQIRRIPFYAPELKQQILNKMYEVLECSHNDYRFERVNKFLTHIIPLLKTEKTDRI